MPTADRVRELIDEVDAEAPPMTDEQADAVVGLLSRPGCDDDRDGGNVSRLVVRPAIRLASAASALIAATGVVLGQVAEVGPLLA
jgi:hypothetical protein